MTGSFEGLLSLAEAAEIMRIDESTIRHAIKSGRMVEGRDCRKFGKQWVISWQGLRNAFGKYPSRDYLDKPYGQWVEPGPWHKRREDGIPLE